MNSLFKTVTESGSANEGDNDIVVPLHSSVPAGQQVFIKDLVLDMFIGVHQPEKKTKQRVIVNVELSVKPNKDWQEDDISNVVSYEDIVNAIQDLTKGEHINLVETFAEQIIDFCLKHKSVEAATVSVEKPDIFENIAGVGVRISRSNK